MWGIPNASKGGTKSEVAHKWADWLHHQCCLGGPRYFKAGDKIKSGSQVGLLATSSLPQHPTIPPIPLESRDACVQKLLAHYIHQTLDGGGSCSPGYITLPSPRPKSGWNCYLTRVFSGVPKQGTKSEVAVSPLPSRGREIGRNCYVNPAFLGVPQKGDKIIILGGYHRFRAGYKIRSGPQVG